MRTLLRSRPPAVALLAYAFADLRNMNRGDGDVSSARVGQPTPDAGTRGLTTASRKGTGNVENKNIFGVFEPAGNVAPERLLRQPLLVLAAVQPSAMRAAGRLPVALLADPDGADRAAIQISEHGTIILQAKAHGRRCRGLFSLFAGFMTARLARGSHRPS